MLRLPNEFNDVLVELEILLLVIAVLVVAVVVVLLLITLVDDYTYDIVLSLLVCMIRLE